jgi:hypothetical protein
MKLHSPFIISSRLAPALQIAKATLSFDNGHFVLNLPDGTEHKITDFSFPCGRIAGSTNESVLQDGFVAILSFLSACAESRAYGMRKNGDVMSGENSNLFPENIGEWAESVSDELAMLSYEMQETEGLISK